METRFFFFFFTLRSNRKIRRRYKQYYLHIRPCALTDFVEPYADDVQEWEADLTIIIPC